MCYEVKRGEERRGITRCGEVRRGRGETSREGEEARQKDKTGEYTAGSSRAPGTHTSSFSKQRCALFSVSLSLSLSLFLSFFLFPFLFPLRDGCWSSESENQRERRRTRERRLVRAVEKEKDREGGRKRKRADD